MNVNAAHIQMGRIYVNIDIKSQKQIAKKKTIETKYKLQYLRFLPLKLVF